MPVHRGRIDVMSRQRGRQNIYQYKAEDGRNVNSIPLLLHPHAVYIKT
jgi:hypothetical protein